MRTAERPGGRWSGVDTEPEAGATDWKEEQRTNSSASRRRRGVGGVQRTGTEGDQRAHATANRRGAAELADQQEWSRDRAEGGSAEAEPKSPDNDSNGVAGVDDGATEGSATAQRPITSSRLPRLSSLIEKFVERI